MHLIKALNNERCSSCDELTTTHIECANVDCEIFGCKKCMLYDEDVIDWFCSLDCLVNYLKIEVEKLDKKWRQSNGSDN